MPLHKLPPRAVFVRRLTGSTFTCLGVVAIGLGIGVLGYRQIAHLSWIDSLLNASMILTGMGPVDPMTTTGAKLFASGYAIFSGVVFLSAVALLLAPAMHRFLHRFHLEMEDPSGGGKPAPQA